MFKYIRRHFENYKQEIVHETLLASTVSLLRDKMLNSSTRGVVEQQYIKGKDVIVSLTSYGRRIYDVCITVESLFQQTLKPNKIVLWIDKEHFTKDNLPLSLKKQQERGLTIEFCKDIRSYTKLVPSLRAYPGDLIITVDDDFIYPFDLVERLVASYRQDPEAIHFCIGTKMGLKADGTPQPYLKWKPLPYIYEQKDTKATFQASALFFPKGYGGILYPPGTLHEDVSREELFSKLCPYADDVWFRVMSLLKLTPLKQVYLDKSVDKYYLMLPDCQDMSLYHKNVDEGANDPQFRQVLEHYGIQMGKL